MPLTQEARAQQAEYSNDAIPIAELNKQVIHVVGFRNVTKKDGSGVLSKKTNKPLVLLVLEDEREVWPTPNVLKQLNPDDPTGFYRVRVFLSDYGTQGVALIEVDEQGNPIEADIADQPTGEPNP